MKFSISMPDELVKKLDVLAAENYCSRSGVIMIAVREWVASQEAKKVLPALTDAIQTAVAGRTLSETQQRDLDTFLALSRAALEDEK